MYVDEAQKEINWDLKAKFVCRGGAGEDWIDFDEEIKKQPANVAGQLRYGI